jgi:hypothetical protein
MINASDQAVVPERWYGWHIGWTGAQKAGGIKEDFRGIRYHFHRIATMENNIHLGRTRLDE